MFKTDMSSTIQMLVDRELDRRTENVFHDDGSITCDGVIVEFDLSARYIPDAGYEKSEHRSFFMLFHGSTSVYYVDRMRSDGTKRYIKDIDPSEWKNTSNHISCWRSDGFSFISEAYFDMCKKSTRMFHHRKSLLVVGLVLV